MRSLGAVLAIVLLAATLPAPLARAIGEDLYLPVPHRVTAASATDDLFAALGTERATYFRVFPPDERERVTPTLSLPASAIALLVGRFPDGTVYSCSGTLIAPSVVLTAAHCLYSAEFGGWFDRLLVVPGADRTLEGMVSPFGVTEAVDGTVPRGWIARDGDARFDFGLASLDRPVGNQSGTLPLVLLDDQLIQDSNFSYVAAGYPGDKPFGTQWRAPGRGVRMVTPEVLGLQADLVIGMSGGPLLVTEDAGIFGIASAESPFSNFARRVDANVVAFAQSFCQEIGCQVRTLVPGQPAPPETPTPEKPQEPPLQPRPERPITFVDVQPARWSTVLPGQVRISATIAAQQPLAEVVLQVAGQEARSSTPTVTLDAWLDPGRYTVTARARDVAGNRLVTMWDIVVSWDLADGVWFDSQGRPNAEAINATARALVEAFRWHLYGMSWDGRDHRGDMPTHAERLQPGEPVPVLVTANGFDRATTEATLRALVEAFRWHLWGISWDGAAHPEVPTHGSQLLPPEPVGPWFTPDGQPIPEAISATLRSLEEAFRWHLYGATWDGQPHGDMPTHAVFPR
ncbi:trypsin-like serine protease [Thermomicrobium sp. 4228-Ro]|uniref:trypsin-like serine peptidase n=1 Tax=Thermomicrobium sp. 4228-Ro TaxID=2993937 RepID=UPI002248A6FC|nr:trypsin-like serine protease [Thermomicrobium sp. 4228-Ro]MCX2726967.1 trypsin-like serine protease [Thermomicrobium sp. 4228-Ro]